MKKDNWFKNLFWKKTLQHERAFPTEFYILLASNADEVTKSVEIPKNSFYSGIENEKLWTSNNFFEANVLLAYNLALNHVRYLLFAYSSLFYIAKVNFDIDKDSYKITMLLEDKHIKDIEIIYEEFLQREKCFNE
jgi:hypothetical protein